MAARDISSRAKESVGQPGEAHSALIELARAGSQDSRRELLSKVADLFILEDEAWSDREAILFNEVLGDLLDEVDVSTRERVAIKVADCERSTVSLHQRLARDEARVAAPVLERSTWLDEQFLTEIATTRGDAHRLAIGARDYLGENLSETLISLGGLAVKRQVARNAGARLTERSLSALTEMAQTDTEICEAVSARTDLSPECARRLFALVPEERRGRLEALMKGRPNEALQIVQNAKKRIEATRQDRRRQRIEVRVRVQNIRSGCETIDALVHELSTMDRAVDLAKAISLVAGVPENVASACVLRVNPEPIVCICRLLALDEATVQAIADMRQRRLRLPESMREYTLRIWRSLDEATASRILSLAKVRLNHSSVSEGAPGNPLPGAVSS
jgi:uncharacterized protein (DUF2336 family)